MKDQSGDSAAAPEINSAMAISAVFEQTTEQRDQPAADVVWASQVVAGLGNHRWRTDQRLSADAQMELIKRATVTMRAGQPIVKPYG